MSYNFKNWDLYNKYYSLLAYPKPVLQGLLIINKTGLLYMLFFNLIVVKYSVSLNSKMCNKLRVYWYDLKDQKTEVRLIFTIPKNMVCVSIVLTSLNAFIPFRCSIGLEVVFEVISWMFKYFGWFYGRPNVCYMHRSLRWFRGLVIRREIRLPMRNGEAKLR